MSDLRYPIGEFEWTQPESEEQSAKDRVQLHRCVGQSFLSRCGQPCKVLSPEQLDTPYRPEGWTVRQVVHHVPESHMNAYIRFKLALTEEQPQIKPYNEAEWAKLPDNNITPIEVSLQLLAALHSRWVDVLQTMRPSDFGRTLYHPERGVLTLDQHAGAVRVALRASSGAHHIVARTHGLEATRRRTALVTQKFIVRRLYHAYALE